MHSASAAGGHTCTQPKRVGVTDALSLSRGGVRILFKVKQGKGLVHVEYKMNCFSNQELCFLVMNETVVDWCSDIFSRCLAKRSWSSSKKSIPHFLKVRASSCVTVFWIQSKRLAQFINNKNFIISWSSFVDACWAFACSMAQLRSIETTVEKL